MNVSEIRRGFLLTPCSGRHSDYVKSINNYCRFQRQNTNSLGEGRQTKAKGDRIVMAITSSKEKSVDPHSYHGSLSYVHCAPCIFMRVIRRGCSIIPAWLHG